MKHSKFTSRRFLALVMAVIMVLTIIPMGTFAVADDEPIVYTVSARKPAIPAKTGNIIDLNKIQVEFDSGTYSGADIDWSTEDKSGGVVVNNLNKTIAYFGEDSYPVTAKYGEETKTIYILQTDESGVATIYDHTFSAADLQTSAETGFAEFTEKSEWKVYSISTEGNGNHLLYSGGIYTDRGTVSSSVRTVAFYLDPKSEVGS